jgi:hypothetical protein
VPPTARTASITTHAPWESMANSGTVKLSRRRATKNCAVPASSQIAAAILEISRQIAKARSREAQRELAGADSG